MVMTTSREVKGDGTDSVPAAPGVVMTALESADVGIFVLGPDFTVRWINEPIERFFGLDRDAVVGRDKETLIESKIKDSFEAPGRFAETVINTYDDNSYVEEFECHVLPGDGRADRWLLHRSHPIREGPLAGGRIEQYTDITERKAYQRKLEEQNDKLSDFAAVVSHDLRNPLLVAEGRVQLARETGAEDNLDEALTAIERSHALVSDLLTLAKQGDAVGERERFALAPLLESCWQTLETGEATLNVESDRRIDADRSRCMQLFENLLRNSVEHAKGPVTVTAGDLEDGFYVADDGAGIPPEARDRAFEPGYTTIDDGTGFGLAIVAEIVDAHGWEIRLTESDGGARFEVTGVETV